MATFTIKEDKNFTNLHVSKSQNIIGDMAVSGSVTVNDAPLVARKQAIGYTNTDTFLNAQAVRAFNTEAGKTASAGTDLQIPVGAYIKTVTIIATAAIIGSSAAIDIGTGVNNATTSAGFFDGVDIDDATAGTGLGTTNNFLVNTRPVTGTTFVAEPAEAAATGSASRRIGTGVNFVTSEVKTANITAGAIKIIIDYDIVE